MCNAWNGLERLTHLMDKVMSYISLLWKIRGQMGGGVWRDGLPLHISRAHGNHQLLNHKMIDIARKERRLIQKQEFVQNVKLVNI